MRNEEEKNELFTLLCYELHFWYRGTLNLADSKYIIIFSISILHQKLQPVEGDRLRRKNSKKQGFLTPTNYLIGAVTFDVVKLWKK